jgi:hypothetical protein
MRLVPFERSLVNRLQGKPFVLLGVNIDLDIEQAKGTVAAQGINWRSWASLQARSGPIKEQWRVRVWPTFYLIDHRGVIRNFWPTAPDHDDLERRINELLKEVK